MKVNAEQLQEIYEELNKAVVEFKIEKIKEKTLEYKSGYLEPKVIDIKPEYKPHQLLALCFYLYNQNYFVNSIEKGYFKNFKFVDIKNLYNQNLESFTSSYITPCERYTYRFTNDVYSNSHATTPKTTLMFKYDERWISFKYYFTEIGYNNYEISKVFTNPSKRVYHFANQEEKTKFLNIQEKIIKKLKVYEVNAQPLMNIFGYSSKIQYTLDFIYNFKNYMYNILNYKKEKQEYYKDITELIDCIENDMQDNSTYNFKILSFMKSTKKSYSILINKSYSVGCFSDIIRRNIANDEDYMIDNGFKIIIPILHQLGGIKELKNLILEKRILTE